MSLRLGAAALTALIAVAGIVAFNLIGGAGRTPTPGPSPSSSARATATPVPLASMPPLSAEFVSPWYGYRVAYPGGWQTTAGQGPWPIGTTLLHRDPHLDEIKGPVGAHMARIVGASIALPDGMGLDGFMAFASSGSCDSLDPLQEPVLVDGIEATVTLNGCASLSELQGSIWDVVLVTGGRGYDFTIDGFVTAAEAQAWLASISLDPASAPAASPAPS